MESRVFSFLIAIGWIFFMPIRLLAQNPLEQYLEEAMSQNITLQQQQISYQKAVLGFAMAKSYFYPSATLQGGYQTGGGGRTIDLPIGDLLNPVYQTLNQLTQSSSFPQIQNESITFLPVNYYDVSIKTSIPLLHTDLNHQKALQQEQIGMTLLEIERYKRILIQEVSIAYYQVLSAYQATLITKSALQLAESSEKVNVKLLESGKGLPAYVQRSKAEVAEANHQYIHSVNQLAKAKYYFNSLLNKEAEAEINLVDPTQAELASAMQWTEQQALSVSKREELALLQSILKQRSIAIQKEKQYVIPQVYAFGQFGAQAEGLRIHANAPYYLVGVQLEWSLFAANRNKHKIRQSQYEWKGSQLALEKAKVDLQLAAKIAFDALQTAIAQYHSAQAQLEAASTYKRLIDKGYEAGIHSHLETLDARNAWTRASLAEVISKFQVLIAKVTLDRELALQDLSAYKTSKISIDE
jgi:outer membrane protein